jgi:hypothetical protein
MHQKYTFAKRNCYWDNVLDQIFVIVSVRSESVW